jgi:hypothetical protein
MSNFLSTLAAKNLNLAPVIQPRPLSLFEPAIWRTTLGPGPRLADEVLDISDSFESHAPHTVLTAQPPASIDPRAPTAEPSARQAPLNLPVRLEPPTLAYQPLEQRREVQREIVNVTNIRSAIEQPLIHAPASERVVTEKKSVVPDRVAPPIGIEPAALPASKKEQATLTPHPIVTPVIERIIHERERAAPSHGQPRSNQVVHHTPPQLTAQSAATEPPMIQVTIGRIEIRATPPAASVKRSTPSSSTLSLDDYLRARDGGQR